MRNTFLWFLQLVTGVLIAVFLGIHVVTQHLSSIDQTTWPLMIGRATEGIWVFLYVALLAVGLYHGINGLRGIILEVTTSARTARIITGILIAIGVIFFIGGTFVPVALFIS